MNAEMVFGVTKLVGGLVGSACGSVVARTALKALKPDTLKLSEEVVWAIGGGLIGAAVGDKCCKVVSENVDACHEIYNLIQQMKNADKDEETDSETESPAVE